MKPFKDAGGIEWVATAVKEDTPRHHGTWYLVFHTAADPQRRYPTPEVRWQTAATAERTLRTMSEFELRRRLNSARARYGDAESAAAGPPLRTRTSANAG